MDNKVVYFHKRNDTNEVFYVGIGNTNRPSRKNSRSTHWWNIVNKVGYTIEILHEGLTWDEAVQYEVKYIKDFGRKDIGTGILVNHTDGGDGVSNLTDETIQRIKEKRKGYTHSKETLLKMGKVCGEKKWSSRLKNKEVIDIRTQYTNGITTPYELAEKYNISVSQIYSIIRRTKWKHIPMIKGENTIIGKQKGEERHNNILSKKDVLYIRKRYPQGGITHKELAKKFGLEKSTISKILRRIIWKHI